MGCPKGWLDYEPIGRVIPSTRIVAFKTPLKRELHNETSSDPTHDRYELQTHFFFFDVKLGFISLLLYLISVKVGISANKTLSPVIRCLVKDSNTHLKAPPNRFTPQDCIKAVRRCSNNRKRLGLVLNLTFTTKYYNPRDFERSGIHYGAIKCPGHEIPNEDLFYQFQRSLYDFFYDYPDRNVVVGVHCTHGVNRTGYMIAR